MAEKLISVDRMETVLSLFGNYDENVNLIQKEYNVVILGRGDDTSGCVQPAPERAQNEFCNGLVQARRTCSPVFRPALYGIEPEIVQDVQQAFDALVL